MLSLSSPKVKKKKRKSLLKVLFPIVWAAKCLPLVIHGFGNNFILNLPFEGNLTSRLCWDEDISIPVSLTQHFWTRAWSPGHLCTFLLSKAVLDHFSYNRCPCCISHVSHQEQQQQQIGKVRGRGIDKWAQQGPCLCILHVFAVYYDVPERPKVPAYVTFTFLQRNIQL